jgi:hypothetical protein
MMRINLQWFGCTLAAPLFLLSFLLPLAAADPVWRAAQGPLKTRWTDTVTPENAWREYPRPQLTRKRWQNLNGLWEYAITKREAPQPEKFEGEILVPFPVESALSGVMRRLGYTQRLWYRRTFEVPEDFRGGRILLHFGAVDWEAIVSVNGKRVAQHRGGYDPFTIDITDALGSEAAQQIVVSVWDPTDTGYQPRGKQVLQTEGVWYTASSGIWQTVWLEPVPANHIERLRIVPDVDRGLVEVTPYAAAGEVSVRALDGDRLVGQASGPAGEPLEIPLPDAELWSTKNPKLYNLEVRLAERGKEIDRVGSYFGMRKVNLGKDKAGRTRILLNGQPIFQFGLLDQGFWPDGLYTAPNDEALRYDIGVTKDLGFNLIRKHVKVEPARWYTWCDRLGILVWQDMPNGDRFLNVFKPVPDPDLIRSRASAAQYERELLRMITNLENHPSILIWIPFNEGWGQFDTARISELVKRRDPSRLVDSASGLVDRGSGEVNDLHNYLGISVPEPEPRRAVVLGEFGGLGRRVEGHMWKDKGDWDYRKINDKDKLTDAYCELVENLRVMQGRGLSGAVYTQTTDVEIEVNGQLTYDREKFKLDPVRVRAANDLLQQPPPLITTLQSTSERDGQRWRFTSEPPGGEWIGVDFDDSKWQQAPGAFGDKKKHLLLVETEWDSGDRWFRRPFIVPADGQGEICLLVHHLGAAEFFVNGQPVETAGEPTAGYRLLPLTAEQRSAMVPGSWNQLAVHVRPGAGENFFDAGVVFVDPPTAKADRKVKTR